MSEQHQLGPSQAASVVLDIGGDIGALIIHAPAELHLAEIEISPADDEAADVFQASAHRHDDGHAHPHGAGHSHPHSHDDGPPRTHVAVRERLSASGTQYAAIYPGLHRGLYTVWGQAGHPDETVRITGGEVAQLDWR